MYFNMQIFDLCTAFHKWDTKMTKYLTSSQGQGPPEVLVPVT